MSLVADIYNIVQPDNPAAKTALLNAETNQEAVKLAQMQAAQGSVTPSWVPWTIGISVLLLVVVGFIYWRSRRK